CIKYVEWLRMSAATKKPTEELQAYGDVEEIAGVKCVLRHPLADDARLLIALGITPEDCTGVDIYAVISDTLVHIAMGAAHRLITPQHV
ncbi:hypothetical protein B4Q13_18345, partial [Lacticaseibacillus rhamnosus]